MRSKLFHCAWVLVAGAAALGCGSTYEPVQPHTASYVRSTDAKSTRKPAVSPLNHAMRSSTPVDPHASHGPISLTGETPYGERFDPSGWSGSSTPPEGTGGGPTSAPTTTPTTSVEAENPYEDESPPMTPTPPPSPTNDQKDLDTAPLPPPADEQPPPQ